MKDPDRLLHRANSPEGRLLAAALDEPPPPHLMEATLAAVRGAAVAPGAATGATAGAAKGGLLGAGAIGALAGVLTVGAAELATSLRDPGPPPSSIAAAVTTRAPLPPVPTSLARPSAPAPPDAPSAARTPPAPGGPRPTTLAVELALLDEARTALREGQPSRAVALLDRFRREIPHAQMAREAALLRAEAEGAIDAGTTIP